MDIISVSVTLFLIMDPFGNVPIFLPLLEDLPPGRRRLVIARELLVALVVIVGFIFCGRFVMTLLGLEQAAVSIAGGIILFLIGLRMVFPPDQRQSAESVDGEPFIVPLAIPLIAGPSLLAVLMLWSTAEPHRLPQLLLAALIAWGGTFVVLFSATYLSRFLTRRGLVAVERLMGMVLVALSVQMLLDSVALHLE